MSVLVRSLFVELKVGDEKLGDGLMAGRRRRALADVSQWKAGGGDERGINVDGEGGSRKRKAGDGRALCVQLELPKYVLGFAVLGVGGWVPASLELAKSYLTALTKVSHTLSLPGARASSSRPLPRHSVHFVAQATRQPSIGQPRRVQHLISHPLSAQPPTGQPLIGHPPVKAPQHRPAP